MCLNIHSNDINFQRLQIISNADFFPALCVHSTQLCTLNLAYSLQFLLHGEQALPAALGTQNAAESQLVQ